MKLLIAVLLILTFPTMASGYHKGEKGDTGAPGKDGATTIIEPKIEYRGIATAIANSQHSFNWGTKAWQGSIGTGHYSDSNALSFGMGKRYGRMLFNGSIGSESGTDKYSFGAGVNWQF